MKELVLYYSFSGHTKQVAEEFAQQNSLTACEIRTQRKLSTLVAYTVGIVKAIKGTGMPIAPPAMTFEGCETAHIFAPVWADGIAPPMNSAIALLPKGCELRLRLVSQSGKSGEEMVTKRLQDAGYVVASYKDIRK